MSWKTSQLANLWLKLWLFMFVAKNTNNLVFWMTLVWIKIVFLTFININFYFQLEKNIWISFCNSSFRSSFGDIPPKTGGVDGRGKGGQSGMVAIHPTSGKISHSNPTTSESMSYSTIMPQIEMWSGSGSHLDWARIDRKFNTFLGHPVHFL